MQGALGSNDVVADVEGGEIVANHRHHHGNRQFTYRRQPFRLRAVEKARPEIFRQRLTHGLEIATGVKTGRDIADLLAQRLAVAQISRAGEHVHLRAGIVDVIFADHLMAGLGQKLGQGIAEDGAAAMAHMQRPGGIGRDIFHVDLPAGARGGAPVGLALADDGAQDLLPHGEGKAQIDEARPGHLGAGDPVGASEPAGQSLGDLAWRQAGGLGQHHGSVGGEIAMGGIARRFHREAVKREAVRQFAGRCHGLERCADHGSIMLIDVHVRLFEKKPVRRAR